jgi:hypothetical protein
VRKFLACCPLNMIQAMSPHNSSQDPARQVGKVTCQQLGPAHNHQGSICIQQKRSSQSTGFDVSPLPVHIQLQRDDLHFCVWCTTQASDVPELLGYTAALAHLHTLRSTRHTAHRVKQARAVSPPS